jgi:signal transduction histidine kinase
MAGLAGLASIALTNARAYVELESRDRTTRDFVIGGTHALRSPLAAVQNMLDLLLEGYAGEITPKQRELLMRARQKNERQLDTVRELLYLTTRDIDSARAAPNVRNSPIPREEVEKGRESATEVHLRLMSAWTGT